MKTNHSAILNLTALWALSESGLGGLLHAFKIPVTGLVLGGFSVLIVGLIAHFSSNKFKSILQATTLVILVKGAISPHTPLPAYLAVAFQGFAGACLYASITNYKLASLLFGGLALLESAIQKFAMMTLFFGKSIWDATDIFFKDICKLINIYTDVSFSAIFISGYCIFYVLWGVFLGFALIQFIPRLEQYVIEFKNIPQSVDIKNALPKKKKSSRWLMVIGVLLFMISTFIFLNPAGKGIETAFYILARTIGIYLFLIYIFNPLIKKWLAKWMEKKKNENSGDLTYILEQLPIMGANARNIYSHCKTHYNGLSRYKKFTSLILASSLADHV